MTIEMDPISKLLYTNVDMLTVFNNVVAGSTPEVKDARVYINALLENELIEIKDNKYFMTQKCKNYLRSYEPSFNPNQ